MSEDRTLVANQAATAIEQAIVAGNLAVLTPAQRVQYYRQVCDSLGLNYYTKPFDYITLNGRLTLYATRNATDQLRKLHKVNVEVVSRERVEDVYVVTARAILPDGRMDEEIGAVAIGGLKGEALANAIMKSSTKAKRRVTLSIVGLGWLDETEVGTVSSAQRVQVNQETGEIEAEERPQLEEPKPEPASFLGAAANRANVITYLEQQGVPHDEALTAIVEMRRQQLVTRQDVFQWCQEWLQNWHAKAPVAKQTISSIPSSSQPEPDATPAPALPAKMPSDYGGEAETSELLSEVLQRPGEPDWASEMRKLFIQAGLPVGLRDAFIAYHVEHGSTQTEALAAYRKAFKDMKRDPLAVEKHYLALVEQVRSQGTPNDNIAEDTRPF